MIRINCPYCGERDHSEFSYGGDATINYPSLDASEKEWTEAIFFRKNIKDQINPRTVAFEGD